MSATNDFFKKKKEWSIIKDDILSYYLVPYLAKISTSKKDTTLIDCFAGTGKFLCGENGSPVIICDQISSSKYPNKFKLICIEKNKSYFEKLKKNIEPYKEFSKVLTGTFEEHFESVLDSNQNKNVFFYIDPYGIKSLDFEIFKKMKNSRFNSYEILMNFNTFGFLREGCRILNYKYEENNLQEVEDSYEFYNFNNTTYLDKIAQGSYWRGILLDYHKGKIDMFRAEELLISKYMRTLREKDIFKYTISIPIKTKYTNIPKYRLVFGTNHFDGLVLMWDNMHKKFKQIITKECSGQISFFDTTIQKDSFIDFDNIISNKIINIIRATNNIDIKDLYYLLLQEFDISYSKQNFSKVLKSLENNKIIQVKRTPPRTRSGRKPTSFSYKDYDIKFSLYKNTL